MNLEFAKSYLKRGFSVIPVKPRSKTPFIQWKPFQDILPTQEEVGSWFTSRPSLNVAIVTGSISDLLVLDIDGDAGIASLNSLGNFPKLRRSGPTEDFISISDTRNYMSQAVT
jgi:hypothetical protein